MAEKYLFIHPVPYTAVCLNDVGLMMRAGDVVELTPAQKEHRVIKELLAASEGARLERVKTFDELPPKEPVKKPRKKRAVRKKK